MANVFDSFNKFKVSQAEYLVILSVLNGRLVQNNSLFVSRIPSVHLYFFTISVSTH